MRMQFPLRLLVEDDIQSYVHLTPLPGLPQVPTRRAEGKVSPLMKRGLDPATEDEDYVLCAVTLGPH